MAHAVPDCGYVPRVILVCLGIVFLAAALFRHIGVARWKKSANKSSFNFFQLIRLFFPFLCGKPVDPTKTNSYSSLKLTSNNGSIMVRI